MFLHQPEEYDDSYGTGHADYSKETGTNEFPYYQPATTTAGVKS